MVSFHSFHSFHAMRSVLEIRLDQLIAKPALATPILGQACHDHGRALR